MINTIGELLEHLKGVDPKSGIAIHTADHMHELERLVIDLGTPGVIFMCKPVVLDTSLYETSDPSADA